MGYETAGAQASYLARADRPGDTERSTKELEIFLFQAHGFRKKPFTGAEKSVEKQGARTSSTSIGCTDLENSCHSQAWARVIQGQHTQLVLARIYVLVKPALVSDHPRGAPSGQLDVVPAGIEVGQIHAQVPTWAI